MTEMERIEEMLKATKLNELQATPDTSKDCAPLILQHTTKALEAFHILAEKEFGACPVQDSDGKIIGTLDLRDAVKFVVDASTKQETPLEFQADIAARPWKSSQIKHLAQHPQVSQGLSYLAKMRPFKVFDSQCDLTSVAKDLSSGKHIVGFRDEESPDVVSKIISQKMLFNAVAPALKDSTFPLHHIMSSPVISVKASAKAFEAFQAMTNHDVSGLAVVDKQGRIIHNVSSNDVKLWVDHIDEDQAPLDIHQMSVEDFLVKIRASRKVKATSGKTRAPVCICHEGDTVGHAVTLIKRTGYHHVWICDADSKPVGVISMTDLFKANKFNVKLDKAQCA